MTKRVEMELKLNTTEADVPVQVRETLLGGGNNLRLSAHLSENGWMWLVANRTLYTWEYSVPFVHCYALTLGTTGLHNSAQLVCVYVKENTRQPGILAVSPEGSIRHWNSANGSYADSNIDFRGQVAQSLQQIGQYEFIVSTTTCSFYMIQVVYETEKRASISTIHLQSESKLSNLSRRMSSFFFQSSSAFEGGRLVGSRILDEHLLLAITTRSLQLWSLDEQKLDWQQDLSEMFAREFMKEVWTLTTTNEQQQYESAIKIWLIDATAYKSGVLILAAAINHALSNAFSFALGYVDSVMEPPDCLDSFFQISLSSNSLFTLTDEEQILQFRLYNPLKLSENLRINAAVFVLMPNGATAIRLPQNQVERDVHCDQIEFEQDVLLGAGCDLNDCYVFLRSSGLMALHLLPRNFDTSGILHSQLLRQREPIRSASSTASDDEESRENKFMNAFLLFTKAKLPDSSSSLSELLAEKKGTSDLANLAADLSLQIIDDFPSNDPRWERSQAGEKEKGKSLLILYQLDGKRKTLQLLHSFLTTMNLWPQMSGSVLVSENVCASTIEAAMEEHFEKLECCYELQKATSSRVPLCLEDAMKFSIKRRHESIPQSLTYLDVFYRQVSTFETLLAGLFEYEQHAIVEQNNKADLLEEIGDVLLVIIRAILKRKRNQSQIKTDWSKTRTFLAPFKEHYSSCLHYLSESKNDQQRIHILKQSVECADFILSQQKSPIVNSPLVSKLIALNEIESALELAEKFRDYLSLIHISECLEPARRDQLLSDCKIKFSNDNFAQILYQFYLEKGQSNRLLSDRSEDVDQFLHDSKFLEIRWIREVEKDEYEQASNTLRELAFKEKKSAARKKTLLSLAKISALCANDRDYGLICQLDEALLILKHQYNIPESNVTIAGYKSRVEMPPLAPEELIELIISDANATLEMYLSSLDLLQHLISANAASNTERIFELEQIKRKIWLNVLKRDDWISLIQLNEQKGLIAAKQSVYFQLCDHLGQTYKGAEVEDLMLDPDQMIDCHRELRLNEESKNVFEYFLRAADEIVCRRIDVND